MSLSLTYGQVVGRYLLAVADGPDAGRDPDSAPATGSITFTPIVPLIKLPGATPPTTVIPQPIVCSFDADGYVLGPDGSVGVYLIAASYRVAIQLDSLSRPIAFELTVPASGVVDLTPNTVL